MAQREKVPALGKGSHAGPAPRRAAWLAFAPPALALLFHLAAGDALVAAAWRGALPGPLGSILEHAHEVPLEVYRKKADTLVAIAVAVWTIAAAAIVAWLHPRTAGIARRVARLAAWVAALLAAGEATTRGFFAARGLDIEVYRRFSFQPSPDLFLPDAELGYRMPPRTERRVVTSEFDVRYRTNALGLRSREVGPRRAGVSRLLLLGDSQTFGWGVPAEARFGEAIEAALPAVEVVNAAVPGWSLRQMRRWLEREGAGTVPDLVVLCLIERDRVRSLHDGEIDPGSIQLLAARAAGRTGVDAATLLREAQLERAGLRPTVRRFARAALERSWLWSFGRVVVSTVLVRRKLAERDRAAVQAARAAEAARGGPDRTDEIDRLALEDLDRIEAAARAMGASLVVAWIDLEPAGNFEVRVRERGIAWADAGPCLTGGGEVTFRIDPHYTPLGHRRIAECLIPALAEALARRAGR